MKNKMMKEYTKDDHYRIRSNFMRKYKRPLLTEIENKYLLEPSRTVISAIENQQEIILIKAKEIIRLAEEKSNE